MRYRERAVALHPVELGRAALDLAHRGDTRDEGRDAARGQRRLALTRASALRAVAQRLGGDLAGRAGGEVTDRLHHAGEVVLPEHGRETDTAITAGSSVSVPGRRAHASG